VCCQRSLLVPAEMLPTGSDSRVWWSSVLQQKDFTWIGEVYLRPHSLPTDGVVAAEASGIPNAKLSKATEAALSASPQPARAKVRRYKKDHSAENDRGSPHQARGTKKSANRIIATSITASKPARASASVSDSEPGGGSADNHGAPGGKSPARPGC
jgi:hypothetical protein